MNVSIIKSLVMLSPRGCLTGREGRTFLAHGKRGPLSQASSAVAKVLLPGEVGCRWMATDEPSSSGGQMFYI